MNFGLFLTLSCLEVCLLPFILISYLISSTLRNQIKCYSINPLSVNLRGILDEAIKSRQMQWKSGTIIICEKRKAGKAYLLAVNK